jgi:hypothetical protein
MPPQLDTVNTFVDGDVVNAASLNNMIDQASTLKGLILDQTPIATAVDPAADVVLLYDASVDDLRRTLVQALPSGVTSVDATATPATVFNISVATPSTTPVIALSMDVQTANKVLAGPVSGAAATPAFRVLAPSDIPIATVTVAAQTVDWSLGNTFNKLLAANISFIFTNPNEGQTIRLRVQQDASHTVAFASPIRWPGGTAPVMTTGAGRIDIFTFHYIGGLYYGTFEQNFLL